MQSAFYKHELGEFFRCDVAEVAAASEVQQALACFALGQDFSEIRSWLSKIPSWYETLRTATARKIIDSASDCLEKYHHQLEAVVADFGRMSPSDRSQTVGQAQVLSDACKTLATTLGLKETSLVRIANKARALFSESSTKNEQQTLSDELQSVLAACEVQDGRDVAEAVSSFVKFMSADRTPVPSKELAGLAEKTVLAVVVHIAQATAEKADTESIRNSRALLAAVQKLHTGLGTSLEAGLRQSCLEIVSPHVGLKEYLCAAESVEKFVEKHKEAAVTEAIHLASLIQRCCAISEATSQAQESAAVAESLTMLANTCESIKEGGQKFQAHLAEAIHNTMLDKVKEHLSTHTKVVGDRGKGQPLWSLRLTRESTWQQIQKEAEITLMREDYMVKVKKLQSQLSEDVCSQ